MKYSSKLLWATLVCALSHFTQAQDKVIFSHRDDGSIKLYYAMGPEGCEASIMLGNGWSTLFFGTNGLKCFTQDEHQKPTADFPDLFKSIIQHYQLHGQIKTKRGAFVNIMGSSENWSLTLFANKTSWWPDNFHKHIEKNYKKEDRPQAYRHLFEKAIMDKAVYGGIVAMLIEETGCALTLAKEFSDPMNYKYMSYTKGILNISKDRPQIKANKSIYPRVYGPTYFEVHCNKN